MNRMPAGPRQYLMTSSLSLSSLRTFLLAPKFLDRRSGMSCGATLLMFIFVIRGAMATHLQFTTHNKSLIVWETLWVKILHFICSWQTILKAYDSYINRASRSLPECHEVRKWLKQNSSCCRLGSKLQYLPEDERVKREAEKFITRPPNHWPNP